MKTICRVPLQVLSLRLSILYLRTCVGLGYGSYNDILFLVLEGLSTLNSSDLDFGLDTLEAAINLGGIP